MAPRWIGTRCRPIDISDAVRYLIGCVRTRGRQVGIRHPGRAGRNSPPRGWRTVPRTDCVQSFSAARMSSAAPTRETGVEEQPAEGVAELFSGPAPSELSAGCRHFHGGTGSRNGAEE